MSRRPTDARPAPATFLVASTAITAHTLNASRLVVGLVAAGHRVLWYAEDRFADLVARCGAVHLPHGMGVAGLEQRMERAARGSELSRVRALYRDEVVGRARQHVADLEHLTEGVDVDVVLSDTLLPAAAVVAAGLGAAWATFGDGPLLWWDETTPPFGTGLRPLRGRAGRHRNRNVQAVIDRWLFGPAVAELNRLRADHGLPAVPSIREATASDRLHLQGCTPGFEYRRESMPSSVRFVGALGPAFPVGGPVPPTLVRANRSRPLALVTQGTLRPDVRELVLPACRALVAEGFDVLVAGFPDGAWNRWPGRVTAMDRVDYRAALAESDLLVTNGGYTGVTLAVDAGVPVIQAGNSEEKPDIGARVGWSGVGASIRLRRPPAWLLRRTISRVMGSTARQAASRRLAEEGRDFDAEELGARWLADLAAGVRHG